MRVAIRPLVLTMAFCGTTMAFNSCSSDDDNTAESKTVKATDYSQKANWLQMPEITKDVDAFYIYGTSYINDSFKEGAPNYAPLDNQEMRQRAMGEYMTNSSVFKESCNVFMPWYRQVGLKYGGEVTKKYGSIEAA